MAEFEKLLCTDSKVETLKKINANIDYTANTDLSNLSEIGEAKFVNKSGDTMTGQLSMQDAQIVIRSSNMDSADETAPSEALTSRQIFFTDKNGNILGQMYTARTVANSQIYNVTVRRKLGGADKSASMSLYLDANGIARFEFPRNTTKPTTTSTASASRTSLVTQNYLNGTSGYRVWSDGYCEQWGFVTTHNTTVTLLKSYSDTNYAILLGTADYNSGTYASTVHTRTKNSFVVNTIGNDRHCFWKTCGYIN